MRVGERHGALQTQVGNFLVVVGAGDVDGEKLGRRSDGEGRGGKEGSFLVPGDGGFFLLLFLFFFLFLLFLILRGIGKK